MKEIYLDNNATTKVHEEVIEAMMPFFSSYFGNPSSMHKFGRQARVKIDDARDKVALLMNSEPSEIVFTSGGSESDNLAIKGVAWAFRNKGNHIITSAIEHPAVLNTCKYLETTGYKVTYLPVDEDGIVDVRYLKDSITNSTILISIHYANNEIGTLQPIAEICAIAHEHKVLFHTDAVQAFGKIKFDVKELNVDMASVSAHKLYGPKGAGALYIKKGIKLHPLIHGGSHEKKRRAGTENVPAIIGFGKACEIASRDMDREMGRVKELRDRLHEGFNRKIRHIKLNGHPEKRLPNTINLSFKFVEGESLLINLDLEGVAVSTGSACSSGSLEPSHVLVAMGIPHEIIHGSLRFSLGRFNTVEDVDYVIEVLPPIVQKVREMSPLWDEG